MLNLSFFFLLTRHPPSSTLFPYTTLFRSRLARARRRPHHLAGRRLLQDQDGGQQPLRPDRPTQRRDRSEEHTSELQSRLHLVCRLLLEKKNTLLTPFLAIDSYVYIFTLYV